MIIELSEKEREELTHLLQREIADLGPEIRHTDHAEYRDELRVHKKELRSLLDKLTNRQPA
jgi:hypothetical protein